jgi:hypothetical protein
VITPSARRVLERVRAQLTGPQKGVPTRVRPRPKSICPYQPGDVLEVTLSDGHRVLVCVQGVHEDKGVRVSRVAVYDWNDAKPVPGV